MSALPLPTSDRDSNAVSGSMPSTERSVFRAEALQHFVQNQEKVVLPNLVSPRAFLFFWIVAALIMVAGLILVLWPWMGLIGVSAP